MPEAERAATGVLVTVLRGSIPVRGLKTWSSVSRSRLLEIVERRHDADGVLHPDDVERARHGCIRLHQKREAVVRSALGELEEDVQRGAVDEHDAVEVDDEDRLIWCRTIEPLLELACVREVELARERGDDDARGVVP